MDHRTRLERWHDAGALSAPGLAYALAALGLRPDTARWRVLTDRLLLGCGVLALLSGIVMMFAANWLAWPRLGRVALAAAVLLAAMAAAWGTRRDPAAHRWAVFAVATLAGVLLAVIGQAYQTGADAWQLFALWALLALPWALYARWLPLWALWLAIASLALVAWQGVHRLDIWFLLFGGDEFNVLLLLAWGAAWAVCDRYADVDRWGRRLLPAMLALGMTVIATVPACLALGGSGAEVLLPDTPVAGSVAVAVLWAAWMGIQGGLAIRRREVFLLALTAFGVWCALLALLSRLGRFDDVVWLLALVAVAGLAAIAWLLLDRLRAWRGEDAR
ncbi:DUF2157 domain-containing protein [Chitiniphilus eburneus]|uniref:DUF2157 domain-containing protein n=1 Tax=Chitiniphilus eburneus TaxID=2571148 RepID=A0A4U0PBG2_9NEIS|nr:DUF2157 domain-containing protein [Chitiniphilus eburneus]TJZ65011.1 DUF2157 domain-containing protein [Chitiniphilus eburneus]